MKLFSRENHKKQPDRQTGRYGLVISLAKRFTGLSNTDLFIEIYLLSYVKYSLLAKSRYRRSEALLYCERL
jgi:hypothetical protein